MGNLVLACQHDIQLEVGPCGKLIGEGGTKVPQLPLWLER